MADLREGREDEDRQVCALKYPRRGFIMKQYTDFFALSRVQVSIITVFQEDLKKTVFSRKTAEE